MNKVVHSINFKFRTAFRTQKAIRINNLSINFFRNISKFITVSNFKHKNQPPSIFFLRVTACQEVISNGSSPLTEPMSVCLEGFGRRLKGGGIEQSTFPVARENCSIRTLTGLFSRVISHGSGLRNPSRRIEPSGIPGFPGNPYYNCLLAKKLKAAPDK